MPHLPEGERKEKGGEGEKRDGNRLGGRESEGRWRGDRNTKCKSRLRRLWREKKGKRGRYIKNSRKKYEARKERKGMKR